MTTTAIDVRHATAPGQVPGMTQQDLRDAYLVDGLFAPGAIRLTYTHHDRIVLGGVEPGGSALELPAYEELRSEYFLENREVGIVNVGGPGVVQADGERFDVATGSCLYLGRGVREVVFSDAADALGAQFYLFSAPAHTAYPAQLVAAGEGTTRSLGDPLTGNERRLHQYIHQNGVRSCQIVMGVTELAPGSMWNTMPAHTHARRTECYLYFDLPSDARVVHLLGEPSETRHLLIADRQAVISPSWSLHSGVGTAAYSFVWSMAGENQSFDDMDPSPITELR